MCMSSSTFQHHVRIGTSLGRAPYGNPGACTSTSSCSGYHQDGSGAKAILDSARILIDFNPVRPRSTDASETSFTIRPYFSTDASSSPQALSTIPPIPAIWFNVENYARSMYTSGPSQRLSSRTPANHPPANFHAVDMCSLSEGTCLSYTLNQATALASNISHRLQAKIRSTRGASLHFLSSYLDWLYIILKMCSPSLNVMGGG